MKSPLATADAPPAEPVAGPPFHEWVIDDRKVFATFHRQGTGFLVRFPGLADFTMTADGFEVRAYPAEGLSASTLEHLRLNQVKPLALSLQGRAMFHGSAVDIGAGAAAFLGRSGQGKSTLAASFASHGHGFLTDDGLELRETPGKWLALPSHASIRLWPDSMAQLASPEAALADPIQYSPKARVLADEHLPHITSARPLAALYVLAREGVESVEISRMGPAEALIALVNHSFLLDIDDRASIARHFERLTRMVGSVPVYCLDFPRRYECLPDVRKAIIGHTMKHQGHDATRREV